MSCRRYRDSVVLLTDGELTGDAANDVRQHVGGCESCQGTLAELERLKSLLTPATSDNPTMAESRFWRSFEADLALRVHREATPFWRRAIVLPIPAAVCMGVAVIALGTMVVSQHREVGRLASRTANLEAHLAAEQDLVIYSSSPHLNESVALMNASQGVRNTELHRVLPMASPRPAGFTPPKVMFKMPAPAAAARSDVPANIEFVDAQGADFY